MPADGQRYLVEGASFRDDLQPELVRLLSEIWDRKKDPLRPCWVVIPAAPPARALKLALLDAGVPLLNVEFLTPGGLHERLNSEYGIAAALSREKQELLLRALLAEEGRNPDASGVLLTAIDAMRHAGHEAVAAFEREGAAFRKVVGEFENRVGPVSVQRLDRDLLKRVEDSPLRRRDVVLYGFDAGDWPAAWVLLAAARGAERSAVFQRNAGGQVESLELAWMAWWREHFGEGRLPRAAGSNFSQRAAALRELEDRMFVPMREARAGVSAEAPLKNDDGAVRFLLHRNASMEARDAAALGAWWASELSGRVGLIFAKANPLSRLSASHLERWGVPFEDQLGSPDQDAPENTALKIWLRIQQEGPHAGLIELLARSLQKFSFDTPLRRMIADPLRECVQALHGGVAETVSDDLRVIARSLEGRRGRAEESLLRLAAEWEKRAWPESAPPDRMARCVSETLEFLFGDHAYELEAALAGVMAGLDGLLEDRPLNRGEWVRYLESALQGFGRVRRGRSYAPVVITSLERARGQCFDGLIFCGLNEGGFPAVLRDLPFQLDKRAAALDQRVSKMGDDRVRRFGLWNGPVLQFTAARGLERQRFWDLTASSRLRVGFSCSIWDDLETHAGKEPSELFDWAWWAARGFQNAEDRQAASREVESATRGWSEWVEAHLPRPEPPGNLGSMTAAIGERFNPGLPFGPHQFIGSGASLWREKLGGSPLAATRAERILKDPASAWFEAVLGVSPRKEGGTVLDALPSSRGSRIHDAVRTALKAGWKPVTGAEPGLGRAGADPAAPRKMALEAWVGRLRSSVERWFGRLPVWWEVELEELRSTAWRVVEFFSAEENSESLYAVELPMTASLGGIRWSATLDHIRHNGPDWCITDLKTGGGATAHSLKAAALSGNGEGFQLVIYAMILADRLKWDGSRVTLRYLEPRLRGGGDITRETLEALAPCALPLIAYLQAAWYGGRFGQRSDRQANRPHAHLRIPDEILISKWNRTECLDQWPWEAASKTEKKPGDEDENEE